MATPVPRRPPAMAPEAGETIPPLTNGDRLTREEFERRYAAMPGVNKAELIEGIVYMPSPVSTRHCRPHGRIAGWLALYASYTPGVDFGDNGTVRLDLRNEPQPDMMAFIEPARGGNVCISSDDYVEGAPELVIEVAASSAGIDLHGKLEAYRRNGVQEYIVWRVEDKAIDWFVLTDGRYVPMTPDTGGVLRSQVLPGLTLDAQALLAGDLRRVLEVQQQAVGTPAHAEFVSRLAGET